MRYTATLLAVQDMEKSKEFYQEVMGLQVVSDFGANVVLEGGIALQTMESWRQFIQEKEVVLSHHAGELAFEEPDMDRFLRHLQQFEISYLHPLVEHRWGQRVIRFYDPDGHVIEVGEDMKRVVWRFLDSGMTPQQVAQRMDVPLDYVQKALSCRLPG